MGTKQASPPTLVLIHGWAAHSGFFKPLLQVLDPKIPTLAPDLPGHGKLAKAFPEPTIQQMSDWLESYLKEQEVASFVLVGWSMGALVMFDYVECYADERLKGCVSIDMTPKMLCDETWDLGLYRTFDAAKNERAMPYMRDNWSNYCENIALVFFAEGREETELDAWMRKEVLHNSGKTMVSAWQSISEQDFRALLPNIKVPFLAIAGTKSQLYGEETAKYLVENIPDATLLMCEASGHAPHMEEPEKVAAAIFDRFYR